MPKVSVIIPTYNRKEWLCEAIDSVRGQSFHDFEILVVDDGSTDGTTDLIQKRYGPDVRTIAISHSGLPASARNAGIDAARGEYIAFLDSDDLWLPDKLALQVAALDGSARWGWTYGNAVRFGDPAQEGILELGRWQMHAGRVLDKLLTNNFVPTCTVLARKTCIEQTGRFDTSPEMRSAEDYEYWMRLSSRFEALPIRRTLAKYRVSNENISKDLAARLGPERLALESVKTKLNLPPPVMDHALASLYLRLFRYTLDSHPAAAERYLKDSWTLEKGRLRTLLYKSLFELGGIKTVRSWIGLEKFIKQAVR